MNKQALDLLQDLIYISDWEVNRNETRADIKSALVNRDADWGDANPTPMRTRWGNGYDMNQIWDGDR